MLVQKISSSDYPQQRAAPGLRRDTRKHGMLTCAGASQERLRQCMLQYVNYSENSTNGILLYKACPKNMHPPNCSLRNPLPWFGLLISNMEQHTRNNKLRLAQRKKRNFFFPQKTAVCATNLLTQSPLPLKSAVKKLDVRGRQSRFTQKAQIYFLKGKKIETFNKFN